MMKLTNLATRRGLVTVGVLTALSSALIAASVPLAYSAGQAPSPRFELKATRAEEKKQSTQKTTDKRKQIVSEAVSTLRETQDALKLLDEGKNKEALASLEKATGKLEIVLARDPNAALVPIDVKVVTDDVYGSVDAINKARQEAQKLLVEGRVQEARRILMNLGSETIISTTNLPMATYPSALKKAAKLIDENKAGEAKEVLQTALNTLVVTDVIIPLPVVDAKISLEKAEELAKNDKRTEQQNKELSELVTGADNDIKFAEALGYGQKADFDSFHKEIEQIRQKTSNGKSGIGFFDQIKTYMESMLKNSQHNKAVAQNK